jgi:hypothetical protein
MKHKYHSLVYPYADVRRGVIYQNGDKK